MTLPHTYATLLSLALLCHGATAHAQFSDDWTPPEDESPRSFHGVMTDLGARYGLTDVWDSPASGYSLDVGARTSFPMYLGDLRLSYRYDQLTAPNTPNIDTHGLGLALAVHPGFYFLLGNGWLWYTLASFYVEIGAGAQLNVTETLTAPSFAWHWGAGIDIPLWNPDATGGALWFNLLWRNHRSGFENTDLNLSTVFLGLSYRFHDLPW